MIQIQPVKLELDYSDHLALTRPDDPRALQIISTRDLSSPKGTNHIFIINRDPICPTVWNVRFQTGSFPVSRVNSRISFIAAHLPSVVFSFVAGVEHLRCKHLWRRMRVNHSESSIRKTHREFHDRGGTPWSKFSDRPGLNPPLRN